MLHLWYHWQVSCEAYICHTKLILLSFASPKGAILTHKLLAICVVGHIYGRAFEDDDVMISYLPLSHIYERFTEDIAFYAGTAIGYSCGDNTRLIEDLQIREQFCPGSKSLWSDFV